MSHGDTVCPRLSHFGDVALVAHLFDVADATIKTLV